MYRGGRGRGRGGGMLYVLALHACSQFAQLERKPPVTAALIVANTLVFLRPGKLHRLLPPLHQACLNPYLILREWDVKRLFLSAFYHVDETHLVYNMMSLMWKGAQLEGSMGSARFAWMVAVLLGLSHGLVVITAKSLSVVSPGSFHSLFSQCAVGFSAVLFALKVVLNWDSPATSQVYGVPVPARHAAWAELLIIQMLVPGTSFLGHLCGILAGLIYVHLPQSANRFSSSVYRRLSGFLLWPFRIILRPFMGWSGGRRTTFGRGHVGRGEGGASNSLAVWRCSYCTYDNEFSRDVCEMCDMLNLNDRRYAPSAPPLPDSGRHLPPSAEEVRQARLQRFTTRNN